MVNGIYDLIDAGADEAGVAAWLAGRHVAGLPVLSPAERRSLADAWWFWARPGQRWQPGREFVTVYECGRGFGKNFGTSNLRARKTEPAVA